MTALQVGEQGFACQDLCMPRPYMPAPYMTRLHVGEVFHLADSLAVESEALKESIFASTKLVWSLSLMATLLILLGHVVLPPHTNSYSPLQTLSQAQRVLAEPGTASPATIA